MRTIPFSPPDITETEIAEVVQTLRTGWITTGPKTKLFEQKIGEFIGTKNVAVLSSATASLELTLRLLGVGPGDEVITSAYTYTATAAVIAHIGAKIVFVDTAPDKFLIDHEKVAEAITSRTKVIIPVDIAGKMCDYDSLFEVVESKKHLFKPNSDIQKIFNRIIILADSAHGFGSSKNGVISGLAADFTAFSFHAVKTITSGEGGAIVWKDKEGLDSEELYSQYMLHSLHGQSKDAYQKSVVGVGSWQYDILCPGYKCNMTDILASIGLVQLRRYHELRNRRREIIKKYDEAMDRLGVGYLHHLNGKFVTSCHIYLTRIPNADEARRDLIIERMAKMGVACNVHFKPLPMMTAYKNMGFDINDYPNAFDHYQNELTLPLHTKLTDEDVDYVIECFEKALEGK
ncbi:capsular polysaccharide biosynthesis protein [Clostridia bacterium]|nr:capsular polysaccharide biosynthesis protein [Clostridia bacterium]